MSGPDDNEPTEQVTNTANDSNSPLPQSVVSPTDPIDSGGNGGKATASDADSTSAPADVETSKSPPTPRPPSSVNEESSARVKEEPHSPQSSPAPLTPKPPASTSSQPVVTKSLTESTPYPALRKFTLLFVFPIVMLVGAGIVSNLPSIAQAYPDASAAQIAFLLNGSALSMGLSLPLAGFVVDKVGRRPVLLTTIIIYAVAGTLPIYVESFALITISRLVLGMAGGSNLAVTVTLIADYYDGPARASMLGLSGAVTQFMAILVLIGSGQLVQLGYKVPFTLYAYSLLLFIPAWISLPEPPKTTEDASSTTLGNEQVKHGTPLLILAPFLGGAFAFGSFSQILTYGPFYLSELGYGGGTTGLVIATATIVGFPLAFLYSKAAQYLSNAAIQVYILFFMGLGLVVFSTAESLALIFVAMGLFGVGLSWLQANLNLWVIKLAPLHLRGTLVGAVSASLFLSQGIMPQFTAPLVEDGDYVASFWFGFVLCVVGVIGYIVLATYGGWTPAAEARHLEKVKAAAAKNKAESTV